MKSSALIMLIASVYSMTALADDVGNIAENSCQMSVNISTIFVPLEPVVVNITLTNPTETELYFALGRPSLVYEIEVLDIDGVAIPLTRYGIKEDKIKDGKQVYRSRLGPKENFTEQIVLSRFYDLSLYGKYSLKFKRRIHSTDTIPAKYLESPFLQFEIGGNAKEMPRAWGVKP